MPSCGRPKSGSSCCAAASAATARRSMSAKRPSRARPCSSRRAKRDLATCLAATAEKPRLVALCDALWQTDAYRQSVEQMFWRRCACPAATPHFGAGANGGNACRFLHAGARGGRAMTALASDSAFASQATFRAVMECFAQPGEIRTLRRHYRASRRWRRRPPRLFIALADYETPIWLDHRARGRACNCGLDSLSHRRAVCERSARCGFRSDRRSGRHARFLPSSRKELKNIPTARPR